MHTIQAFCGRRRSSATVWAQGGARTHRERLQKGLLLLAQRHLGDGLAAHLVQAAVAVDVVLAVVCVCAGRGPPTREAPASRGIERPLRPDSRRLGLTDIRLGPAGANLDQSRGDDGGPHSARGAQLGRAHAAGGPLGGVEHLHAVAPRLAHRRGLVASLAPPNYIANRKPLRCAGPHIALALGGGLSIHSRAAPPLWPSRAHIVLRRPF